MLDPVPGPTTVRRADFEVLGLLLGILGILLTAAMIVGPASPLSP